MSLEGLQAEGKLSDGGGKVLEAAEDKIIQHIGKIHKDPQQ